MPVAGLLAPAYIAERRKLISPDRSMGTVGPGLPPGYVERGTSHISIVDRWGNAVSFTTTIEAPFGAQMMVGGFILNNELTDFSALPEIDGQPVANRVEPGKRPRSSMSPTFVLDRDRRLVAGGRLGRRPAHHRRYAAGADRHARLEPSAQAALDLPRSSIRTGRPNWRTRARFARPEASACARWAMKYKSAGMKAA